MKLIFRIILLVVILFVAISYFTEASPIEPIESETVCLKFYPHDSEIRKITKRVGISNKSRQEIFHLMNQSHILCSNCWIKTDNDLIEFL